MIKRAIIQRVVFLLIMVLCMGMSYGQQAIIIDHTSVDLWDNIPQAYLDTIKKRWLTVPGESHSRGYRVGLQMVEDLDAAYAVSVTEAGTPEAYTTTNLRASRATWGDYNNETGWIYNYGEEDWWTNPTALSRTKAGITYCNSNDLTIGYIGFGWCYDMSEGSASIPDPVYGCSWYGWSQGVDPEWNPWGLDEEDNTLTGNSINMDTYIKATEEFIDYCADSINTTVFYTTASIDNYEGNFDSSHMYQAYLKHEHLRDYVKANGGILFDYADILCYDDGESEPNTMTWNDTVFQAITATNYGIGEMAHIDYPGALRLGKALWVMMAVIEGWEPCNTSTWNGIAMDGDWTNPENWLNDVPIDGDHAIIPGGLDHYPTIESGDGAHVDCITIEDGGSLIGAENLTVDDTAFMQRYFSPYTSVDNGWHIISSPMQAMPIRETEFVPGSSSPNLDDLFIWDEDDYYWRNYKIHFFSPFQVGKGYLHAVETAATKEFYGDFNESDFTNDSLTYTPTMGNGWHILGNPFQSALIWNETGGDWILTNIMATAKILKNDGTGYLDLLADDVMAANQGFFIKVLDDSPYVRIPLSSRAHSSVAFQKSSSEIIKLKAILEDERYISINIGLNETATPGFDTQFDGYHLSFTGIADMYSYHEDDRLSTNYIPYPESLLSLPIVFSPYQDRDYVMKAENIEIVLPEYEITLEDKKASQVIDLRETGGYAFSSNKNDDPDRFVLHLKNATGIMDGLNGNSISMYVENKELSILIDQPVHGQLSLINAMGQVIFHKELERKGINRYKLNVTPGVYMVRIVAAGMFHTGKVYVQ